MIRKIKRLLNKIDHNPLLHIKYFNLMRNIPTEFYEVKTYKQLSLRKGVVDSYDSSITYRSDVAVFIKDSVNKIGIAIRPRKGKWVILSSDYFLTYVSASEYLFNRMIRLEIIPKKDIGKYRKYKYDFHTFQDEVPHLFI